MSKFRDYNAVDSKIIVYVVSATGLPVTSSSSGTSDPYVKIKATKQSYKTRVIKKSVTPKWEQFFYIESPTQELLFQVLSKDKFCGQFTKQLAGAIEECPEDCKWKLQNRKKPKSKKENASGDIHVRLIVATRPDLLRSLSSPDSHHYYYAQYMSQFKTGDLIAYSDVGLVPSIVKLTTGTPFVHVGLIVSLPNKWTQESELYVVEVTSNKDEMLDAFREDRKPGVNIFRLLERIHQYHGAGIWWASSKAPMSVLDKAEMMEWVWDTHEKGIPIELIDMLKELRPSAEEMLRDFGIGAKEKMSKTELYDLYSPVFVATALQKGGQIGNDQTVANDIRAIDCINLKCYNPPVVLKITPQAKELYIPTGPAGAILKNGQYKNSFLSSEPKPLEGSSHDRLFTQRSNSLPPRQVSAVSPPRQGSAPSWAVPTIRQPSRANQAQQSPPQSHQNIQQPQFYSPPQQHAEAQNRPPRPVSMHDAPSQPMAAQPQRPVSMQTGPYIPPRPGYGSGQQRNQLPAHPNQPQGMRPQPHPHQPHMYQQPQMQPQMQPHLQFQQAQFQQQRMSSSQMPPQVPPPGTYHQNQHYPQRSHSIQQ